MEGGTRAYVVDATPSGSTVALAVELGPLGAAPDLEGLDVRALAPWAAAPTDPSEGTVEIAGIEARARSVRVSWNPFGDQNQYEAVIAPAADPKSKFAGTVQDSVSYRFVNLEPDAEYEVRVGARGDDSTQAARAVKTLPAGQMPYYAGLNLAVTAVPGSVDLSWTDNNDAGSDRYRVERSVDGGPFVEMENQPGAGTEIADRPDPAWSGKHVKYRVFEWVGSQKLYSERVSFTPEPGLEMR